MMKHKNWIVIPVMRVAAEKAVRFLGTRTQLFLFFCLASFFPVIPQAEAAVLSTIYPVALPCTFTIPASVSKVDGLGNYAQVRPGDTLCLPAGTRGNIRFYNLHGTAERPITIQNSGGRVRITGTQYSEGIAIIKSSYIRITGTGTGNKCGSGYTPTQQECGIELDRTYKGIVIFTISGGIGNIEIDHLHIHDTSTQVNSRGIVIRPVERQTISGIYVHHNYIFNTRGEGLYIGAEPHGQPLADLGKLENVEINHNLVEQTGYDGIKVKVAISNVQVHHNIVRNTGLRGALNHESGIQLAMSAGDIYNNFVATGIEGIAMGRPLSNPGTRYFNNIVVGSKNGGILAPENNPRIYNNTVVKSGTFGIKATGLNAQIYDNIVAGIPGTPIQGRASNIFNNYVGSITSAGFVDPNLNNFHLLPSSPAINAGRNSGVFPPIDYDNVKRPQGSRTDLGAFEFVPLTIQEVHSIFFPIVYR